MKQERKKLNLFLVTIISIFFICLFTLPSFATSSLPGDFVGPMGNPNPDGKVDFNDLMVFATAYGSQIGDPNWNELCDLCGYLGDPNPDKKINFDDLMVFATNYGKELEVIIPEPIEAISQEIDLSIGGTVEVTDPENIIYGVKLIIPPIPSEKRGGKSTATMTISYIDNPYSLELPDNRGFLLPPIVINSDVSLDVKCTLEIPYTEADLNNMGLSTNENIIIYHYNYTSLSWEEVTTNKRSYKDKTNLNYTAEEKLIKIFYPPFGLDWMPVQNIDSIYVCSYVEAPPSFDLGFPQSGDLLYRKSNVGGTDGWIPGHVGIYVGEKYGDHDDDLSTPDKAYNVIEALHKKPDGTIIDKVMANYYNPIREFADKFNTAYMGARQPDSGALTSEQRSNVLKFLVEKEVVGKPYAWYETLQFLLGLARGNYVKGMFGDYNCVGLTEAAYEYAGINLVSDEHEGNNASDISARAVFWPIEQYKETDPAEGYTVSGQVTDSQGVEISDVTLNFELVSFNDYHISFKVTTDSDGKWSSDKLGREWNVTPQKDGYIFEPSTIKVKENANNINFTSKLVTPEIYTITASAGLNGSISPSGNVSVNQGSDKLFTITPDTGCNIADVLVDGNSVGAVSSYTFTNVTEDHTISTTFSAAAIGPVHNLNKGTYHDTIQAALDNADNDNTIEVADGTYDESITFPSDKKVLLRSVNGASATFIRGNNNLSTVILKFSREGTTLEGFTITHASGNYGRGIYARNNSYLIIKNCTISDNELARNVGSLGGGICTFQATLDIVDSTISNNEAHYGGGICIDYGTLRIIGSTISNNKASMGGGICIDDIGTLETVDITDSTISNNKASSDGGGIHNDCGTLDITNSTIDNNEAGNRGGGIYNQGTYHLSTITSSIISDNFAANGGGIYNDCGTLDITNSTISNNEAYYYVGSPLYAKSGYGGGIYNLDGSLTITSSIISDNFAANGGGICMYLGYYADPGPITITIGGNNDVDKNTICGNYKTGEDLSLDQQIRDDSGNLYETYKDTNYISAYCD